MGFMELLLLAIALSMDAFAVSICKGLAAKKITLREMGIAGVWFGGFQALMPLIGYFLGRSFQKYITAFDHWIAFGLLVLIGVNMVKESFAEEQTEEASFGFKIMFTMAVATSIDALAVGITFALLPKVNIMGAVFMIGITTFVFSAVGVQIGHVFGSKYKAKAELIGGIILIMIGAKILFEHLNIIG